jgi:hypothetical protein
MNCAIPEKAFLAHSHPTSHVPNPPPSIRPVSIPDHCLDQELLNLNLHAVDGTLELRSLVSGNGARNNGARDSAGTSKSDLAVKSREW